MKFYDIFNGDADGICALHQLRLVEPQAAELITGVKRDTALVDRAAATADAGDCLTVLDVSLRSNARAVERALLRGARVRYFDHHAAGDIPRHPRFEAHIDTAPDVCTSLLVDRHLDGRHRLWAVVAAFGDNLVESALRAAQPLQLDRTELARLHELGEAINYNAYGETVDDLHYHPADLYRAIAPYADPRHFIFDEPVFEVLKQAGAEDLSRAGELQPEFAGDAAALYVLPDASWSRRVNGVFGNRLAQAHPQRAHAVLVAKAGGGYAVSVRAPRSRPVGADVLCLAFATGGGRQAAAGINHLPAEQLPEFIDAFRTAYK
ncbi:MAG: DHH family phosphoesterase [Burkholderiales bacterium]|nr:DHH family phosphoesterase [Burkholderiales bacterium]